MLITVLITFILTVSAVVGMVIAKKMLSPPSGDIVISPYPRYQTVLSFFFFFVGLALLGASAYLRVTENNNTTSWCMYGLAVFFLILSLVMIVCALFDFAAIDGDRVIRRELFFTRRIAIADIDKVVHQRDSVAFYKKIDTFVHKALFSINASAPQASDFMTILEARMIEYPSTSVDEAPKPADIAREHFKRTKIGCIFAICLALLASLMLVLILLTSNSETPTLESLTEVSGSLEYCEKRGGGKSSTYILIALEGDPIQYYMAYDELLDRSFFDEVTAGDEVKMRVDHDSLRDSNGKDARQRINCYTLSVGDREYITYEEYKNIDVQNTQLGWWIALLFFASASIFAIWIAVSYAIYRGKLKKYD